MAITVVMTWESTSRALKESQMAGMAVVMAASMCSQVCTISNAQEVFRGYEHLLENLTHFMHIAMATEYFE